MKKQKHIATNPWGQHSVMGERYNTKWNAKSDAATIRNEVNAGVARVAEVATLESTPSTFSVRIDFETAEDLMRFTGYAAHVNMTDGQPSALKTSLAAQALKRAKVQPMPEPEELPEAEAIRRGALLAEALKLKRDTEHRDRWQTNWGTKTNLGLFLTVKRLVEAGA